MKNIQAELRDVQLYFEGQYQRVEVLNHINLQIKRGDFVAIQGKSGSGKSTLLNLLGGFLKPNKGEVIYEGNSLSNLSENQLAKYRRKSVGFVFQSFHLFPNMSALENVAEPLFFQGVRKKERLDQATKALKKVGLEERIYHKTQELSGGQQQRVSIARALVTNPDLILADEPTGNLDPETEAQIISLLKDINQQDGKTIVVVTHDEAVSQATDHIFHIERGELTVPAT